jgi:hypothetical protein
MADGWNLIAMPIPIAMVIWVVPSVRPTGALTGMVSSLLTMRVRKFK